MQSFPSNFRGKWSQIVRKREKSHPEQQQQHPPREIPSIYFAYLSTETISPIDFSLRISTKFPLSTNSSSNTEGSKKKRWNFSAFYPVCSCVCVCDFLGVERVRIADSKKKTVSSFRPRPAKSARRHYALLSPSYVHPAVASWFPYRCTAWAQSADVIGGKVATRLHFAVLFLIREFYFFYFIFLGWQKIEKSESLKCRLHCANE